MAEVQEPETEGKGAADGERKEEEGNLDHLAPEAQVATDDEDTEVEEEGEAGEIGTSEGTSATQGQVKQDKEKQDKEDQSEEAKMLGTRPARPFRSRRKGTGPSTGLRAVTMLVVQLLQRRTILSYEEIANEVCARLRTSSDPAEARNIRRRAYDVINVMAAVGFIQKRKKRLFSVQSLVDARTGSLSTDLLMQEREERLARISLKESTISAVLQQQQIRQQQQQQERLMQQQLLQQQADQMAVHYMMQQQQQHEEDQQQAVHEASLVQHIKEEPHVPREEETMQEEAAGVNPFMNSFTGDQDSQSRSPGVMHAFPGILTSTTAASPMDLVTAQSAGTEGPERMRSQANVVVQPIEYMMPSPYAAYMMPGATTGIEGSTTGSAASASAAAGDQSGQFFYQGDLTGDGTPPAGRLLDISYSGCCGTTGDASCLQQQQQLLMHRQPFQQAYDHDHEQPRLNSGEGEEEEEEEGAGSEEEEQDFNRDPVDAILSAFY